MRKALYFSVVFQLLVQTVQAARYGRDAQQMASLQNTAAAVQAGNAAKAALPVPFLNSVLEDKFRDGSLGITVDALEKCREIYPNGSFAWGEPNTGINVKDRDADCVAVVYMKTAQPGANPGSPNDKILAEAHIPAGTSIKCNISEFPEIGYLPAAGTVEFPADNPPTEADVEDAMDKEQKNNAGVKTAAAALVGGAAGWLITKDSGDMKKTVGGIVVGAGAASGLQYASTQTGKVKGDVIMSAGVNAAAGAVVGNMAAGMAGDDSVLMVKDCLSEKGELSGQKCLWGYAKSQGTSITDGYYNKKNDKLLVYNSAVKKYELKYSFYGVPKDTEATVCMKEEGGYYTDSGSNCDDNNKWAKISSGLYDAKSVPAMIENFKVSGLKNVFGVTMKDFREMKLSGSAVGRNEDGTKNNNGPFPIAQFIPMQLSATDGETVDFANKARLKDTALGAGAGAALGGVASYQAAKSEIYERWVAEEQNYQGSLANFYCMTGSRFLGRYNDTIIIPEMKKD